MNLRISINKELGLFVSAALACFLGLAFYNNAMIMYSLIAVECITLIVVLISGKNELYLCLLLIFITMSQEFSYFLETNGSTVAIMYSFKETRIAGLNLGLVFTGLFFVKLLMIDKSRTYIAPSRYGKSFIRWLFVLAIIGIFVGAFNILINDNNINGIPNVWFTFLQESSYGLFIAMLAYCTFFVLEVYGSRVLEKTLLTIMICNLLIPLFTNIMGIKGTYGGKELYLTLSSYILCMFIVILPAYEKYKNKLIPYTTIAIIGVFYPLFFKSIAFGKMLLLIVVIIFLFFYIRSKQSITWFFMFVMLFIAAVVAWSYIVEYLTEHNSLFGYKYKQILSLLSIWNSGWYDNLLPSPKVRITEFINIVLEYVHKPWFVITGKGILGSVKDYLQDIPMFNLSVYSYNEFIIQSYYGMHETINIFFLQSGILGLTFLFKYLNILFINIRNNPWIAIGSVWLLLLWGYSVTRSTFGLVCLCLGLYLIGTENNDAQSRDVNICHD